MKVPLKYCTTASFLVNFFLIFVFKKITFPHLYFFVFALFFTFTLLVYFCLSIFTLKLLFVQFSCSFQHCITQLPTMNKFSQLHQSLLQLEANRNTSNILHLRIISVPLREMYIFAALFHYTITEGFLFRTKQPLVLKTTKTSCRKLQMSKKTNFIINFKKKIGGIVLCNANSSVL